MVQHTTHILLQLYETDETAWLEAMSALIQERRFDDLDYPHLSEYLADTAKRDRREVKNRLRVLVAHVLKWDYQPDKRSTSWRLSIVEQRQELVDLLESGVLRNHAEAVLADAYQGSVEQAMLETHLPSETFPRQCPYTLDQLLSAELLAE